MVDSFTTRETGRVARGLLATAEKLFATHALADTDRADQFVQRGFLEPLLRGASEHDLQIRRLFGVKEGIKAGAECVSVALAQPASEESLVAVLHAITDVLVGDPLYRRLLTHPEELDAVTRRVGPEQVACIAPRIVTPLLDYLTAGQRDGVLVEDIAPEILLGVIRVARLVVMHRDLFGEAYQPVLDATIRTLARGMLR